MHVTEKNIHRYTFLGCDITMTGTDILKEPTALKMEVCTSIWDVLLSSLIYVLQKCYPSIKVNNVSYQIPENRSYHCENLDLLIHVLLTSRVNAINFLVSILSIAVPHTIIN